MDKFKYKDYEITVYETGSYNPKSADNKPYANIIETEKSNYKKYIEMRIELYDTIKYVLLIVSAHTLIDSHSCIALHDNGLFMMLNSVLCVFNPEILDIDQQTRIDPFGTMFDVYPYKNDYILYGETDIYRVSSCLDIMWRFSARDIFVRYTGDESAFEMKEDRICLYDFLDNYYEIDYNGKIICEKINESQSITTNKDNHSTVLKRTRIEFSYVILKQEVKAATNSIIFSFISSNYPETAIGYDGTQA